ncbi:TerB family tellurite resistance protein [Polaromonas sp.]|uniref:TerB family tellurite resistance protein n=1 Tax=Polaromonas sp. TaxID=1869339 RepID=UPI0013B9363D|nr:TerB family tellurite resistance protein [Polaromonas sp.]NDP61818.1 TerB family tellurite resistance protein [Polaromonas sp.]
MRSYPRNSPQAATRILALAMLADGHQCPSELALLERLEVHAQLGLSRAELHAVVHTFCEDLMAVSTGMCWADLAQVRPDPLRQVLAEVDDPALQCLVMELCISLVEADRYLTDTESVVLAAALLQWGLPRQAPLTVPASAKDQGLAYAGHRAA